MPPQPTAPLMAASRWADRLLPRSTRGAFWYGVLLSLSLAWTLVIVLPVTLGFSGSFHAGTADGYWQLGASLIRGHGYVFNPGDPPVLHRPPLMPCLYAPLTLLPPSLHRFAVAGLQSLMVGATCWLLFDLANRIGGLGTARLSVGLLMACPTLYFHVKNPMCPVAQMLLALAIVNLLARELQQVFRPGTCTSPASWSARAALLGVSTAAAILTHGTMLLSVPLLFVGVMTLGIIYRHPRLLVVPVVAGCLALLLVAPWTWRNWVVTHRFIPVVANGGFAYLWGVAHWAPHGGGDRGVEIKQALQLAGIVRPVEETVIFCGILDPELNATLDRRMREHIRQHPVEFVQKSVLNAIEYYFPVVFDLWRPHPWPERKILRFEYIERAVLSLWHGILWGLALVGLWRYRRSSALMPMLGLLAVILALACPYFPFLVCVPHSVYTMSTMPLLMILVAGALEKLCRSRLPSEQAVATRFLEPEYRLGTTATRLSG